MKLLLPPRAPSSSAKYDPVKFREYMSKRKKPLPRSVKRMDIIISEIMQHGCSYIRASDKETIRGRMRREGLRWKFTTVSPKEVKITPKNG